MIRPPQAVPDGKDGDMAVSLTYHPGLYLGESINEKKLDKLKRRLEEKPLLCGAVLITLSQNGSDQLDIFEARQLAQRYYAKHPPCVVGVAGSRKEAFALVERMARECLRERGDCALKEYLLCWT